MEKEQQLVAGNTESRGASSSSGAASTSRSARGRALFYLPPDQAWLSGRLLVKGMRPIAIVGTKLPVDACMECEGCGKFQLTLFLHDSGEVVLDVDRGGGNAMWMQTVETSTLYINFTTDGAFCGQETKPLLRKYFKAVLRAVEENPEDLEESVVCTGDVEVSETILEQLQLSGADVGAANQQNCVARRAASGDKACDAACCAPRKVFFNGARKKKGKKQQAVKGKDPQAANEPPGSDSDEDFLANGRSNGEF